MQISVKYVTLIWSGNILYFDNFEVKGRMKVKGQILSILQKPLVRSGM